MTCLLTLAASLWPAAGLTGSVAIGLVQDRVYRAGAFLVVEALVSNQSASRMDAAEVSVEFYNFFDELIRAEHTIVLPTTLSPGQKGTLRIVTPFAEGVRSIRYRFTWRHGRDQFQEVAKRDVWTIGQPTRAR